MRLERFKDKLGKSRNNLGSSIDSPCVMLGSEVQPRTVIDKCRSRKNDYMSFSPVKFEHLAST